MAWKPNVTCDDSNRVAVPCCIMYDEEEDEEEDDVGNKEMWR
jgi:hypothetical protein